MVPLPPDVKHKLEAQGKEIAAVSLELSAKVCCVGVTLPEGVVIVTLCKQMRSRSFSSILTQTGELRRDIELKLEKVCCGSGHLTWTQQSLLFQIGTTIASFDSIPSVEPLMK